MKYSKLLTLIFLLNYYQGSTQALSWKWARNAVGHEYDQTSAVATDGQGHVYVAGNFSSDSLLFANVTLQNANIGFADAFVARYDSSGNLVWARSAGGSADDKATAISVDPSGNVYVTGYFYSPVITFGPYVLNNAGNVGDIFIVKYDSNGNILWAVRGGGPGLEMPYSIKTDQYNHFYVTGRFSSNSVVFGSDTLLQAGSMDIFLVKYDTAGTVIWAVGAGGGSNDEGYAVDIDGAGNVLVGGYFSQNASFGSVMLISSGISDAFLAKYDSSGNILWAKKAAGNGDDRTRAIKADASGNCYITGHFTNDSISFGNLIFPNQPGDNTFIAKYDMSGNVVWAHTFGGDSKSQGLAIHSGSVFVCGSFFADTLTYAATNLLIDGNTDFFLVSCSFAGLPNWAIKQTSGGGSNELATCLTTDSWGNLVMGGYFDSDPIQFGPTILSNTGNGFDAFVARLGGATTSVNNLHFDSHIKVFPNPVSDQVFIYSSVEINKIEIVDLNGRLLQTSVINRLNNEIKIDLSNFRAGLYFLRIYADDHLITQKLIVN